MSRIVFDQARPVVESDPARTANVVAPLTGRITELKVGLGDHVTRNQLLAVIESGDMAQAYADVAKATDALALAKKGLDRAHGSGSEADYRRARRSGNSG